MNDRPKVLIVSHNVFSRTSNMGKTLCSYFNNWDVEKIAQLYFHNETPNCETCKRYYRFTDTDALKGILFRRHKGTIFSDVVEIEDNTDTDSSTLTSVYNYGRKRSPFIYLARDGMWLLSSKAKSDIDSWVNEFNPDAVFFASGDYIFSYRIARRIARKRDIPLIVCCFDDYYLYNRNENLFLGKFRQKIFLKNATKTIAQAQQLVVVNEKMKECYEELFNRDCKVFYTGIEQEIKKKQNTPSNKEGISYLGGLGLSRDKQLVQMGIALKNCSNKDIPHKIDVYSTETDPKRLCEMNETNGISFHGAVSSEEVKNIIDKSIAVIHTESFEPRERNRTRLSLSTKIAESLSSNTCLVAYGPSEVASISYLKENNAAFVISEEDTLQDRLEEVLSNETIRKSIVKNANSLAEKNHKQETVEEITLSTIKKAIKEYAVREKRLRDEDTTSELCV